MEIKFLIKQTKYSFPFKIHEGVINRFNLFTVIMQHSLIKLLYRKKDIFSTRTTVSLHSQCFSFFSYYQISSVIINILIHHPTLNHAKILSNYV